MQDQHKRFITVFVILGISGVLSLLLFFQNIKPQDTVQIKDFPRTIADWTSEEIPISKQDLAILETDNAFVRKYTSPQGESVYLYMVYSQSNRKVSHPPEICYTGGGIQILQKSTDSIYIKDMNLTIQANQLLLKAPRYDQIAYYWFKEGDMFTANYWKQQLMVVLNTVLGKRKGSALIRLSSDINKGDKQATINIIKRFAQLITPSLFQYLP